MANTEKKPRSKFLRKKKSKSKDSKLEELTELKEKLLNRTKDYGLEKFKEEFKISELGKGKKSLEKISKEKQISKKVSEEGIEAIMHNAMDKYIGTSIEEIAKKIKDKIEYNSIIDTTSLSKIKDFKEAKHEFKKQFLKKILSLNYGNISKAADMAGIDRRSIHRLLDDTELKQIRQEMKKPYTVKEKSVSQMLEKTISEFKEVIHPQKYERIYENVPEISKDIVEHIPLKIPTLKEAESKFEKQFLTDALKESKYNISKTAKQLGIRFETLHRKIKELEITFQ